MSDVGRDGYGAEEDRLPWLEPVEEDVVDEGVSAGRLIAGLVVALIALGLVVGGVYWLKQRAGGPGTAAGDPTLIAAQPGPVKVKPADAGGMQVKGQGDSAYAASEGADPNAKIDLSQVPEAPVAKGAPAAPTPTPAAPAPAPVVAAKPAAKPVEVAVKTPAPAPVAAAPVVGGSQVQLGAFSSEAKANAAWKAMSGRFAVLTPLAKSVVPAEVNGKTMYRLRAGAGKQASDVCAKLKVAGETCLVVG
ncbi:MAG: hypothetical protein JWO65_1799 [Sphingomonas bacterium]|jgi:hypothetical protein|nr:hypothetical protein [Sphingomonas bacterium]